MNHFVPDFDTDDDYVHNPNSSSSSLNLPRKSIMSEENDLMELLWHNGQVVVQNQRLNNNNNNNTKKPSSSSVKLHGGGGGEANAPPPPPMHQQQPLDQNLFIQEDEMTSWLHYPLRDDDFCPDLLFSSASATPTAPYPATSQVTAARPPVPSSNEPKPPVRNFMNFSRLRGNFTGGNGRGESGPSISKAIVRESTQVSPSATPSSAASDSGLSRKTDAIGSQMTTVNCGSSSAVAGGGAFNIVAPGLIWKGKSVATPAPGPTNEILPGTSSSVVSKNEIKPETEKKIVDERKRKAKEATEETESRSVETKQARGSTSSTKRSRAAEVHNLSERKRRDRINERMKALQELIPRCNKSDKASMLDEAIEYMKSLQLQIQMISMGCGMMPMMYTGMQQYMPHMPMGMNQPLPPPAFMPFPNMVPAQRPLPTQTHMGGSVFSAPHYPDPSRVYVPNQQCDPNSSQPQYPAYIDPYQQFRNLHPTQPPQFQNQETSYPSSSRVSSSKESEDQENHTTG